MGNRWAICSLALNPADPQLADLKIPEAEITWTLGITTCHNQVLKEDISIFEANYNTL